MPEEEENLFGDTNKVHLMVKVHSTKQKITVSDNEVKQLSKYCDFIGRVMEGEVCFLDLFAIKAVLLYPGCLLLGYNIEIECSTIP